jgi:hypothetical protein
MGNDKTKPSDRRIDRRASPPVPRPAGSPPLDWLADDSGTMAAILAAYRHRSSAATFEAIPPTVSTPSLLVQTIIVRGERTNESTLIVAVALPWFDIIDMLKRDPNLAYQLSPEKWEEIVAGAYKKAGFDEVTLTPRSGRPVSLAGR